MTLGIGIEPPYRLPDAGHSHRSVPGQFQPFDDSGKPGPVAAQASGYNCYTDETCAEHAQDQAQLTGSVEGSFLGVSAVGKDRYENIHPGSLKAHGHRGPWRHHKHKLSAALLNGLGTCN